MFLKVMTSTSESLTSKGAKRVFPCKISTDVGIAGTWRPKLQNWGLRDRAVHRCMTASTTPTDHGPARWKRVTTKLRRHLIFSPFWSRSAKTAAFSSWRGSGIGRALLTPGTTRRRDEPAPCLGYPGPLRRPSFRVPRLNLRGIRIPKRSWVNTGIQLS